ncbi:riboflavin synthase [Candidatus Gracilibacteria bacterium]|nr:riboflavin synthase [Candidatus Gracilibacteria bacterium]
MFSGIIEHKAKILTRDGGRFVVENTFDEALVIGQSIAHDGACMTLTNWSTEQYEFFVMEESLRVTNFGKKIIGDFFNVEQSLKLGDRIDGHMVTGHIDTTGVVRNTEKKEDGSMILSVSFDTQYQVNIIQKGSITINGVSLTIMETGDDFLSVSLIPLTQDWTNLGLLMVGDIVNLEFDMIGKYVAKILQK